MIWFCDKNILFFLHDEWDHTDGIWPSSISTTCSYIGWSPARKARDETPIVFVQNKNCSDTIFLCIRDRDNTVYKDWTQLKEQFPSMQLYFGANTTSTRGNFYGYFLEMSEADLILLALHK